MDIAAAVPYLGFDFSIGITGKELSIFIGCIMQ